jgi:hypothetical protein
VLVSPHPSILFGGLFVVGEWSSTHTGVIERAFLSSICTLSNLILRVVCGVAVQQASLQTELVIHNLKQERDEAKVRALFGC